MKKIILSLLFLFGVIGFAQTDNSEFDRILEAEMKSASSTQNLRVNPNTQNYDVTYHELRFTVDPDNTTPYINGIVKIVCRIFANCIEIEISDTGKGIENVEMARKPLYTSKPNLERSGMGFTIMESFMDEINVDSVLGLGTKVTMKKFIKKEEAEENIEKIELANLGRR